MKISFKRTNAISIRIYIYIYTYQIKPEIIKPKHIILHHTISQIITKPRNLKNKPEDFDIPGSPIIRVVTYNDSVVPRSPSEDTTVTNVVLDIADDSTLRERPKRKNISNDEICLLTTVDELTRVHALRGYEKLLLQLVPERVAERDSGEWGSATRVVDDVSHHSLEVPVALAEVQRPEPGRTLAVVGVGFEDRTGTLTLCAYDSTHFR